MCFVFVAEEMQGGEHRIRSCLSQAAERVGLNVIAQLFQLIDILHCGLSLSNLCEDFQHTFRADTAGRTLSAGLLHRKFQEEFGDVYHTVVFIEDNQAAGAHHRADGDQVVIVDGDIKMLCRDTAAGRPAGLCRLELLAARDPAADLLHDFTQSRSHRNLD